MTQDEIIEMAREAGFKQRHNSPVEWWMYSENIVAFYNLVAAKEREALAQPEQEHFALKHRIAELEGAVIGLQAQLAQPEQKPKAWKYFTKPLERRLEHLQLKEYQNSFDKHEISALKHVLWVVKQPRRTWVGLTAEERNYIWNTVGNSDAHGDVDGRSGQDVMNAIEAKLKEKNT